ncbi:MAG TPA: hypothetical protein VNA89_12455 [Gemmatimonadaceae bacterium]|nr:hypothetical protein [Gemmatimonadaceae bacterium]
MRPADPSTRSPNGDQVKVVRPQPHLSLVVALVVPLGLVPVGLIPLVGRLAQRPVVFALVRRPRWPLGVGLVRLVGPQVRGRPQPERGEQAQLQQPQLDESQRQRRQRP